MMPSDLILVSKIHTTKKSSQRKWKYHNNSLQDLSSYREATVLVEKVRQTSLLEGVSVHIAPSFSFTFIALDLTIHVHWLEYEMHCRLFVTIV